MGLYMSSHHSVLGQTWGSVCDIRRMGYYGTHIELWLFLLAERDDPESYDMFDGTDSAHPPISALSSFRCFFFEIAVQWSLGSERASSETECKAQVSEASSHCILVYHVPSEAVAPSFFVFNPIQ